MTVSRNNIDIEFYLALIHLRSACWDTKRQIEQEYNLLKENEQLEVCQTFEELNVLLNQSPMIRDIFFDASLDFLKKRWKRIRGTDFCYPLKPRFALTQFCLLFASHLATEDEEPVYKIAMPTLRVVCNEATNTILDGLIPPEFVLDDQDEAVIQVYDCLVTAASQGEFYHSALFDGKSRLLSPQEKQRVIKHSKQTEKCNALIELLQNTRKNGTSIGAQIRRLGMRLNEGGRKELEKKAFNEEKHSGCSLVVVTSPPQKKSLQELAIKTDLAYVRYTRDETAKLYYIDKSKNRCFEVRVPQDVIQEFDRLVKPNTEPRILSPAELEHIRAVIGERHEVEPGIESHRGIREFYQFLQSLTPEEKEKVYQLESKGSSVAPTFQMLWYRLVTRTDQASESKEFPVPSSEVSAMLDELLRLGVVNDTPCVELYQGNIEAILKENPSIDDIQPANVASKEVACSVIKQQLDEALKELQDVIKKPYYEVTATYPDSDLTFIKNCADNPGLLKRYCTRARSLSEIKQVVIIFSEYKDDALETFLDGLNKDHLLQAIGDQFHEFLKGLSCDLQIRILKKMKPILNDSTIVGTSDKFNEINQSLADHPKAQRVFLEQISAEKINCFFEKFDVFGPQLDIISQALKAIAPENRFFFLTLIPKKVWEPGMMPDRFHRVLGLIRKEDQLAFLNLVGIDHITEHFTRDGLLEVANVLDQTVFAQLMANENYLKKIALDYSKIGRPHYFLMSSLEKISDSNKRLILLTSLKPDHLDSLFIHSHQLAEALSFLSKNHMDVFLKRMGTDRLDKIFFRYETIIFQAVHYIEYCHGGGAEVTQKLLFHLTGAYRRRREKSKDYHTCWGQFSTFWGCFFGYSQKQKLAAADQLLKAMDNNEDPLSHEQNKTIKGALQQGDLGLITRSYLRARAAPAA